MAFSIAADIDIVMRFQPPSLDGIFHLPCLNRNPPLNSKLCAALSSPARTAFRSAAQPRMLRGGGRREQVFLRSSINGARLAAPIDPILIGTAEKEGIGALTESSTTGMTSLY